MINTQYKTGSNRKYAKLAKMTEVSPDKVAFSGNVSGRKLKPRLYTTIAIDKKLAFF